MKINIRIKLRKTYTLLQFRIPYWFGSHSMSNISGRCVDVSQDILQSKRFSKIIGV